MKNISENQKKIWCMVFFTFFLILIIPSLALASATPPGTTPVENVTLNGHSRPGYILSDGRFALQYAHDGEKGDPGNDYLVGYGKVGTFGTSFTSLSTPLLKDGITDKAYIDNVLQKEYGGGDSFHNITDVGVNPWKAKAGELADQAYIDAFQKTYNDDATIQAACGTENSNPDFWNCKYQTADKAGDAANNTSFNNSAQQAYALEHHNGLCYVGAKDGFLDVGNCLAQGMYYLLYAFSSILTLVGILFNFIIKITLVDMSKTVGSLKAINVGWIAFRDIANIVFIFALLYISIATILRLSGYAAKDLLVKLIIAALLINFSLFFTKIIIDSSNILSINFYHQIQVNGASLSDEKGHTLADAFMGPFELQSIASGDQAHDSGSAFALAEHPFTLGLVGSIFMLLAAFVFISASILFLVRFTVLVILMVLSPLAFAGSILPKTKTYSDKWWSTLASESFFAPLFMLLIWFVLTVVNDPTFKQAIGFGATGAGNTQNWRDAINNSANGGSSAIILNFGIVITFLIASLIISKQMGAKGGDAALKTFNGLRNTTQGFIFRNALGRPARRLEEAIDQSNLKFLNRAFPSTIRDITTRALAGAKFGGKLSGEEAFKQGQERASKREAMKKATDVRNAAKTLAILQSRGASDKEIKEAKAVGEKLMGKLTSHEIRESFSRSELTKNPVLLSLANFSQVKGIYEDEHKLNEEEKDHMLEEYYADLTRDADAYKKLVDDEKPRLKAAKIAGGMSEELAEIEAESEAVSKADKSDTGSRLRKRIRAMQVEEFEMLNNIRPDFLVEPRFVPMVRSGTMETLRSSRVLTNSQRDEMRAAKYAPYDRLKEAMVGIYRGADEAATAAGTPLVLTQLQIDDLNRIETIMQRTVSDRYSPKETASAPGSIRKNAVTWQNLNRGVLNLYRGAQGKDQYEAVDIIKFYKRAVDAGAVTAEMANVLEWMGPTGPKEGKEFYAIASGAGPDAQINFAVAANARVLGAGEFITDLSVLGKDHVLNV